MYINLGQCVDNTKTSKTSKSIVGSIMNISIYLDQDKINTLCLEVEILANDPSSSSSRFKYGKILKIGSSTDKNLSRVFIKAKALSEGSQIKFV